MKKSCNNCTHTFVCKARSKIYDAFRCYFNINTGMDEKIDVGLPRLLASACCQYEAKKNICGANLW